MAKPIAAPELKEWMESGRPLVLLDVLPAAAFEECRLPGARNACVYEVTFLDQAAAAIEDQATPVVVYGSRAEARDTTDAAERLAAAGYTEIHEFAGGREAWQQAGFACEGTRGGEPWVARPVVAPADRTYAVDPAASVVEWTGRNIGNRHYGTLRITGGEIAFENGQLARGAFEIDMTSIEVGDLEGEMAAMLKRHLEHEDFFAVARFPAARFVVREVRARNAAPGHPNCDCRGDLTLRGVTNEIAFAATAAPFKDDAVALEAHFDLDRTRWGANYGSGRLYDRLGMHLVDDGVSLQIRIVAR